MSRVLLLGCGTQGLAITNDLNQAGHEVYLLGERNNYADASRYLKKYYVSKYLVSSKDYLSQVLSIIKYNSIETIIPMGDALSEFLSKNKNELLKYVHYVLPDNVVYQHGVDKNQLMCLCKQKGYPHPWTINTTDVSSLYNRSDIPFPLLIKPNITCGARGMTLVNSYEELVSKLPEIKDEYGDCHLQQYVKQGGAQVEVQLYVNENKELVCSSVIYKYRWYPEKGGSSCCAKSVKNEKIVDILYHLLLDLQWTGFADFDTIEDPDTGELLIMELNPRVPACVKCVIEAGMHWGQIIADGYLGNTQKKYDYKEGIFLRHLGFEVLWFFKSSNRFKTRPNWFKFFGKNIHYQDMSDWTDPLPFITGTIRNIRKVLENKEKVKIKK